MGRMGRKVQHKTTELEALMRQLAMHLEGGDPFGALGIMEELEHREPERANWLGSLADLYLQCNLPGLGLHTYRRFLQKFPQDEVAPQVRDVIGQLEKHVREAVGGDDAFEVARELDVVRLALMRRQFDTARQAVDRVLALRPKDIAARNNLSLIQWEQGQEQEAILTALAVVEEDKANLHALANLVHFLQVCGLEDEMREAVRKLQAVPLSHALACRKRAEALTFAGDDAGVVACLEEAQKRSFPPDPVLLHLGAVAAARLSRKDDAEQWWRQLYGPEGARQKLSDPWAFTLAEWLGTARREALEKGTAQDFPGMKRLAPILRDRGDPKARKLMEAFTSAVPGTSS